MALRWSCADVMWIGTVGVMCFCICCADQITDRIYMPGNHHTTKTPHTSLLPEGSVQRGAASEFSTARVSSTDNSDFHSSSNNHNELETMKITKQWRRDNQTKSMKSGGSASADGRYEYVHGAARQHGENIVAAVVVSPTDFSTATNSGGLVIHVILFTSWQLIVVMICLEVFVYCVTIFIIFGFGRERSRAKRFGHFSWKRPGPQQLEQETSFSTITSRGHHVDHERNTTEEPLMKSVTHKMIKKPSVRGHRP